MTYIFENWDVVFGYTLEHLSLVGQALAIALLFALPVGVAVSRVRWLATGVLAVLGIIYTVPSLALLGFLIPFTGLGSGTLLIALVAYAQVTLVRNITLAFNGIDPAVVEAAKGMGMSGWQRLYRVEFPLALPVIFAGVRVTVLLLVGLATIGGWVAAGGLGRLLYTSLKTDDLNGVLAAALMLSLLAILADQLFRTIERFSRRDLLVRP